MEATGEGEEEATPRDGVHLPNTLVYQRLRADIEVAAAPLLKHMLEHPPRVWAGHPERDLHDNTPGSLKSHCHKANNALAGVAHPDRLSRIQMPGHDAHICWVPADRFAGRGRRKKSEGNRAGIPQKPARN